MTGELFNRLLMSNTSAMSVYEMLLNKVSELSLKIDKMQSDLREFEKQRVDPINEKVDGIKFIIEAWAKFFPTFYENLNEKFGEVFERLENIENKDFSMESKKCDHEYGNTLLLSNPPKKKCIKCGEIE